MDGQKKKQIILGIQEITDLFYQNQLEQGIERLPELIKSLTVLAEEIEAEKQEGYTLKLKQLVEAMGLKDYVLLSDILVFELSDYIE